MFFYTIYTKQVATKKVEHTDQTHATGSLQSLDWTGLVDSLKFS